MRVLKNISILYTCTANGGQGDISPVKNASVAWEDGRIKWVGSEKDLPEKYSEAQFFDAEGKIVIPGLVDCHTHLCFGGWREDEFEMRLQGKSYLEIAKAGGGILSTVKATRKATEEELYVKASGLLEKIIQQGVTTIECKSGYGLSLDDELKQLRVYKKLREKSSAEIVSTFLGAHTFPPEYKDDRKGYINLIINEMIPRVAEETWPIFAIFLLKSRLLQLMKRGKYYWPEKNMACALNCMPISFLLAEGPSLPPRLVP